RFNSILPQPPTAQPQPTVEPVLAVPADLNKQQDTLVALYERVMPGVVSIRVITENGGGSGSGFVYDKQGHIITNYHVVQGAKELEVDFPSGYKAFGTVVGTDLDSDLAVLLVKAPESELQPLSLGDSDTIKVGQTVVAIGNPFGLNGTMTTGIISAIGRTLDSEHSTPGGGFFAAGAIIQTDAAINPGNSGGPLFNLQGEVIGVNRAIRTTNFTSVGEPLNSGIGFAISINIVKRVVPELIRSGKYDYPYVGISSRSDLSLFEIEALKLPRQTGAYIVSVQPNSPAEKAGLRGGSIPTSLPGVLAGGDLIVATDGYPVHDFDDFLSYLIINKSPGDTIVLTIVRDGKEQDVSLVLGKRP
ncbi:MAG: S1C family serine protease, partial [Candidatus Villigracilaceae bacterium]